MTPEGRPRAAGGGAGVTVAPEEAELLRAIRRILRAGKDAEVRLARDGAFKVLRVTREKETENRA